MEWAEVLNDKSLQDLPYKIELNKLGQIVMSPAANRHGNFQMKIGRLLADLAKGGEVIGECSLMTSDNVKVADVVWASEKFMVKHRWETPYPVAPEICVEILSPSNSEIEITGKRELYLARGAREVWICDALGSMRFYDVTGEIKRSRIFSKFPKTIV